MAEGEDAAYKKATRLTVGRLQKILNEKLKYKGQKPLFFVGMRQSYI